MTIRFKQFLFPCVVTLQLFGQAMSTAWAGKPPSSLDGQLERGIAAAQACEIELDDDLTAYGECVGHAADRLSRQPHSRVGLHFQAWLIADLAARQGSTRSAQLRLGYQQALERGLRRSKVNLQLLCKIKNLDCAPVNQRLGQKLGSN